MARELELKFQLNNRKYFVKYLSELGVEFSEAIEQTDFIFLNKGKSFDDLYCGEPVVRIRVEKNNIQVNIKKYFNGIVDREEIEFEIFDVSAFRRFLFQLGLIEVVTVKKRRATASYKGVTLTLDFVEDLGYFTEIEILSDDKDVYNNLNKLHIIAKELHLNMNNLVKTPYDQLLFIKKNDFR